MDLQRIQTALREMRLDGWLFYDFHNRDSIGYRILGLDESKICTRRWFYFVPAEGEPVKLVHTVEAGKLDSLPGKKEVYLPWKQQHELLRTTLSSAHRVAMQYSPDNMIPYVSMVDAGTVELIRGMGIEVVSSANLVQGFEAYVGTKSFEKHVATGRVIQRICDEAFAEIGRRIRDGKAPTEFEIMGFIQGRFQEENLIWDDMGPIVAVNEHAADPHFEPTLENTVTIKDKDLVLIDLWARMDHPDGVYYDVTWMGFVGQSPDPKMVEVFEVVRDARDAAVQFIDETLSKGREAFGWQADDAARNYIRDKGYADYFLHRTGHSIGREVHGNGVNIDNLETRDDRILSPGSLCSIEPGIYLPEFGVRSEINIYVNEENKVVVTGPRQMDLIKIG